MNRQDAKDAKLEKEEPSSDERAIAFNVTVLRRGIKRVIQTR